MQPEQKTTGYSVQGEVAAARVEVGDITAAAAFAVSEVGVLRRENLEIALASEVLRLRAALVEVSRRVPGAGHEGVGDVAREALANVE